MEDSLQSRKPAGADAPTKSSKENAPQRPQNIVNTQREQSDAAGEAGAEKESQSDIDRLVRVIKQLSSRQDRLLAVVQRALKIEEPAVEISENDFASPSPEDCDPNALVEYRKAQVPDEQLLGFLRDQFWRARIGSYCATNRREICRIFNSNTEGRFLIHDMDIYSKERGDDLRGRTFADACQGLTRADESHWPNTLISPCFSFRFNKLIIQKQDSYGPWHIMYNERSSPSSHPGPHGADVSNLDAYIWTEAHSGRIW
jgi:hypothetical protein